MTSLLEQSLNTIAYAPNSHIRYHSLTTKDVERMVETGVLDEDDRIELINGKLVEMSPPGRKHIAYTNRMQHLLTRAIETGLIISVQNPVQLSPNLQPEPDLALLKWRNDFYVTNMATPEDIVLLIEVSDSSLIYDQEVKVPLYGTTGVSESWIISVEHGHIDVYRDPSPEGYTSRQRYTAGESLTVPGVEGASLEIDQVFSLGP